MWKIAAKLIASDPFTTDAPKGLATVIKGCGGHDWKVDDF